MTLAELVIKLSADTASLRTDFDKAGKYAMDASNAIKSAFSGLTFAAVGAEVQHMANTFADAAAQVGRASKLTGMGTQELSGLRMMAKESGIEFNALADTLAKAGRNIEAGLLKPTGQAGVVMASLFNQTELAALKLEPAGQRIQSVTQKVFSLSDAGQRSFAASAIFGRGWTESAGALQKLASQGLDPAMDRAREFHQLFGDDAVKAAREFKTAIEELHSAFEGFEIAIGSRLARPLTELFGLLSGNKLMVAEFADEMKLLGLGGLAQFGSATNFGGKNDAALAWAAKTATDIATHQHALLDQFHKEMGMIGAPPPAWIQNPLALDTGAFGGKKGRGVAKYTGGDDDTYQYAPDDDGNAKMDAYYKTLIDFTHQLFIAQDSAAGYKEQMSKLNDALKIGLVTTSEYSTLAGALGRDFAGKGISILPLSNGATDRSAAPQFKLMSDSFQSMGKTAKQFGADMSASFVHMIEYGRGFNSMLQSALQLLAQMAIQAVLFKQIAQALGFDSTTGTDSAGGLTGLFGMLFGGLAGGRASGGPVTEGGLYMVGETGPELFAPGMSGSIIPGAALGGGGGNTVNIDARGAHPGVEHLIVRAWQTMQKQIPAQALASAYEYHMRGGQL